MTRVSLSLLALSLLAASSLVAPSADACVNICGDTAWQAPSLLTPEVPADLGPMVLAVRTCKTPALEDVSLTLTGPNGAVPGATKQIEQVEGVAGNGSPSRHGRIIVGFVPEASLQSGATYTLTTTVGGVATPTTFVATQPWGGLVAPALAAPVIAKKVPTRVCCQGSSGCGGGSDPDPYPAPQPVLDTTPPPPSEFKCAILSTTDEPEAQISFPLPVAANKIFFDYHLYDQTTGSELAYFSGRRLPSAEHHIRLEQGKDRCFRLEMIDLLRGEKTSSNACTGVAFVPPITETHCDGLESYTTCPGGGTKNATLIAEKCAAAGGAGGAGGEPGETGGGGGTGVAGQPGEAAGTGGSGAAGQPGEAGGVGGQPSGAAGGPTGAGQAGRTNADGGSTGGPSVSAGGSGGAPTSNPASPADGDGGCSLASASGSRGSLVGLGLALAALGARWRSRQKKDHANIDA